MDDNKRKELVDKINEMRASGISVKEASKKLGIAVSQYYDYSKRINGGHGVGDAKKPKTILRKAKPRLEEIAQEPNYSNLAPSGQIFCLVGSFAEIAATLKQIRND